MPEIYVACLASYNNAHLHGEWIDAAQDADVLMEEIEERVLKTSPYPNILENAKEYKCANRECGKYFYVPKGTFFPTCRWCKYDITILVECHNYEPMSDEHTIKSEEWAIHDYDDFEGVKLGEYENLEKVSQIACGLEEYGEEFGVFIQNCDYDEDGDVVEEFEERRAGVYKDYEDYGYEYCENSCDIPDWLTNYIDYEYLGREMSNDMITVQTPHNLFMFYEAR